jgi:predicted PolB exonuclease-like 3'-5' exonuclease
MNKIIIDIETIPNQNLSADMLPSFDVDSVKCGNIKDPDKIAEKIEQAKKEFETGLTKKLSVESNYCQIISLGYIIISDDEIVGNGVLFDESNDKSIIERFNNIYNGETIIGWNSKSFDIPIIWKRSILNGIKPVFNARQLCNPYRDDSIDLMHIWNNGGMGKMSECAKLLGIECKTGLDGSMIYQAWKEKRYQEIKDYNLEDCETTLAIYKKLF